MTDMSFNVLGITGGRLNQGASTGRRLGQWGMRRAGPNNEVTQDLQALQSRSRQLRRDNAWVGRAIMVGTANEIGTGIKPSPNTGNDALNVALKELWVDWLPFADYQGVLNVYGLQCAMSIARKEAGECFLLTRRTRIDRTSDSPVPLEFQLVESDQLASDLSSVNYNGGIITNGVERTVGGKLKAYWFHNQHPDEHTTSLKGSSHATVVNRIRVPIADVIHHFRPDRPGQLQGKPETVRAIVRAKNFEDYTDAELNRKKTRSDFTGVIEKAEIGDGDYNRDPITGQDYAEDDDGSAILDLEPGTVASLLPGEKLNMFDTDQTGQGFDEYQRWQLLAIAAATGVPYQLITGDYSLINDRVWRAIFNNYKRELQQVQELFVIPQICNRIWREFVKRAVVSGAIDIPEGMKQHQLFRVNHRTQAFDFIHPVQDVDSKVKMMQAGFTSRTAIIDELSGGDESSISIDAQRALDYARETELSLASLANFSALPTAAEEVDEVDEADEGEDEDDSTSNSSNKDGAKK